MNRSVLLLLLPLAAAVAADPASQHAGMRDAATHDQLSRALRMAQQNDPIRALGKPAGKSDEDPAKRDTGRDLIKESTILCYKGSLTLLPKQAVLHLPDSLKGRLEVQPNAKVLTWADFHRANRGWIRTVEVSREQAMGQAEMPEEVVKTFQGSSSVVVATFKGGPISVLPYTAPEEASATPADPASTTNPAQP